MKTEEAKFKVKPTPPPLFSCGFFRQCTQTVVSPTTSTPPPLPLPPPPSTVDPQPSSSSSSSSSNSTSQSFTQWKFPLPHPHPHPHPPSQSQLQSQSPISPPNPKHHHLQPPSLNLPELFHVAELHFTSGSALDRVKALYMLETSLVPNPPELACPPAVIRGVIGYLKERVGAKPATKVLLALCLAQVNREMAVEVGAVGRVVEALADLEGAAAERALAALELMCMVEEGAAELRSHALAVPMIVEVMGRMGQRGREYAISVLAVIYTSTTAAVADNQAAAVISAPPEEVARAVVLGLQGDCTARGRRKGAQLLKTLGEREINQDI